MEQIRDFKGIWIPKEVWLDERLNALEKIILMEIDSLDSSERGCFASNHALAEFCQCGENKISVSISKLIKLGYLYVKNFDGRTRELKSNLAKKQSLPCEKPKADLRKTKESNINNNNIDKLLIKDIVEFLNLQAETHYRVNTVATTRHIKARIADGYTLDDFKAVITKMCKAWKGSKMEQYLRPETLFGSKFEGYLNATIKAEAVKPQSASNFTEREYTAEQMDAMFENIHNYDDIDI